MTSDDPIGIPFEEAHWDLVPGRTALVVIDPQNDFLHPDGWYAQKGIDISHMRRVIKPTQQLLKMAGRSCGCGHF
jgi:ureidoacrylate peracid hydrolase